MKEQTAPQPEAGDDKTTEPFTIAALQAARTTTTSGTPEPMVYSSQAEQDDAMHVVWGKLPDDLQGHAFFLSPNGSPLGTYPIPKAPKPGSANSINPEYGANVLAGYGYLTRIDFDTPGQAHLKGRMLQAPSWFADTSLGELTGRTGGVDALFSGIDHDEVAHAIHEAELMQDLIEDDEVNAIVSDQKMRRLKSRHRLFKAFGFLGFLKTRLKDKLVEAAVDAILDLTQHFNESTKGSKVLEQLAQIFFSFNYGGTPRYGLLMGFGEQLNTALTPINVTGTEKGNRLLATSDFGRHWYINPENLAISAPLAPIKDYAMSEFPLPWIFPIVLGTAHPVFDPDTREFFGFNFTQNPHVTTHPRWTMLAGLLLASDNKLLQMLGEWLKEVLEGDLNIQSLKDLESFLENNEAERAKLTADFNAKVDAFLNDHEEDPNSWVHLAKELLAKTQAQVEKSQDSSAKEAAYFTYYTADDAGQSTFRKVQLVDEQGQPVVISQAAHQLGLTKDYLMVINAAFKTTMDVSLSLDFLFNYDLIWNPLEALLKKVFPEVTKGDFLKIIRLLTTSTQDPYTDVYVAKRSEIAEALQANPKQARVQVKHFKNEPEYVHALANFANEDEKVTYYSMNNAALCVAEWLRWYDKVQLTDGETGELAEDYIGLVNSTAMDVGRLGKYVLDMKDGTQQERVIFDTSQGEYHDDQDKTQAGTWGIGLYGFEGYLSTTHTTDAIENIFVISGSPDYKRVTEFIYNLYRVYPNREVPAETILEVAKRELPMSLLKLQTSDMTISDHFVFPSFYYLYSTQFIPKPGSPPAGVDKSLHGYVLCLMLNQEDYQGKGDAGYYREFWLFDAANLKQGPLCVLGKPDMNYVFGLHSAWMPNLESTVPSYNEAQMKQDYGYMVKHFQRMYRKAAGNKMLLQVLITLYFNWLENWLDQDVYKPFQKYRSGDT